jgi:CRISPR/Cas system endoribonuclease Cas6 (RAMP superfamily)
MDYELLVNSGLHDVEPTEFRKMPFDSFWAGAQSVFQRHLPENHVKKVKGDVIPLYSEEACERWADIRPGRMA